MTTIDLESLELTEFIGKSVSNQRCKATFPLVGAQGSKQLATVYFEIAPGDNLGMHTDSAEELIVVLEGELEAIVDNKRGPVTKGSITLIPQMAPHDFRNVGSTVAKVLGVFGGANNIVATFENEWLPTNSNIVDTALIG